MEDLVERELAATHRFLTEWFAGLRPRTEAHIAAHFVGRLDPGFQLIDPTGEIISVDRLAHELWSAHGTGADFAITADNLRCRLGDGEIAIASYHEWQRNAVRSIRKPPPTSPWKGEGLLPANNGRIVTAVFRADAAAENGLRWVHVHETWLPAPVVEQRFAGLNR